MYVHVSILYARLHTQFQHELVNFKHLPKKIGIFTGSPLLASATGQAFKTHHYITGRQPQQRDRFFWRLSNTIMII